MIAVLIIPTGVGAAIGGNAGDGNPVAKLLASCCDTLITHPNVVNASDINEMTENTLYVEGSMLDRFLRGKIELQEVRTCNKILVVANPPITNETINAVSAARATIGVCAEVLELRTPLQMVAKLRRGVRAGGYLVGERDLIEDVRGRDFDALAIQTAIELPREVALAYYRNGGINPWGGVEAMLSKVVSLALDKPVAHAPLENTSPDDEELYLVFRKRVEPRIAAEAISNCYLHSVLKGLHRAPRIGRIGTGLSRRAVDVMISPYECWGEPHDACQAAGIPIIAVRENTIWGPVQNVEPDIIVENYLEAAGLLMSMQAGVCRESVRATFGDTKVI